MRKVVLEMEVDDQMYEDLGGTDEDAMRYFCEWYGDNAIYFGELEVMEVDE